MPRSSSSLPPRVYVIAVVILGMLAALTWFVNQLGAPAGELPTPPVPEPVVALEENPPAVAAGAAAVAADAAGEIPSPGAETLAPVGEVSAIATETITLRVFVAQAGSRRLTAEARRVSAPTTLAGQAQGALETLVREGQSPLPRGTVVREVWVSPGGVAYVDFAADFPRTLGGGSLAEIHAVYGVVGTLTSSFPNIRFVQFLVNGRSVDTFNGHLDLSRPLGPLRDWLF